MKKQLLILSILTVTGYVLHAQNPNTNPPILVQSKEEPKTQISNGRLNRIDKTVEEYIKQNWLVGAVAIIYKNGKPIYHKSFGYNDLDKKSSMQKDAIFRIASQTKAITSTAIMILYEQGKLLLDDPVSKYIPEFGKQQVLDKFNEKDTTYTTVPAKGKSPSVIC